VDAENVLLYNVGTGCLAGSARGGVRFERAYAPPPPGPSGRRYAHYQRYRQGSLGEGFRYWEPDRVLARWTGMLPVALDAFTKPAWAWLAVKRSRIEVVTPPGLAPRYFALRLRVQAPTGATYNPAAAVKPLFDGAISAFHAHDGTDIDTIVARLTSTLGVPTDELTAMLTCEQTKLLGPRRLLWSFGAAGVQWNPRDDACVAGELIWEATPVGSPWTFEGVLATVHSRPAGASHVEARKRFMAEKAPPSIEERFHQAMVSLDTRALQECGYDSPWFRDLVARKGGVQAARQLLQAPNPQVGLRLLHERGRLDLSV
jgi:hypothetical protein